MTCVFLPIGTISKVSKLFLNQFTKEKYQYEQINKSKFPQKSQFFSAVI